MLVTLLATVGYLLYRYGVYREAGIIQPASIVVSELLRWTVLGSVTLIVRLDSESSGPLNVSGVPNLRNSQVGINGMMNPAPSPMRLFIPENFSRMGRFLPLISFFGFGVSL